MTESRLCERCGAPLAPDMRFCESCGKLVAPAVTADCPATPLADPPAAASRSANRGMIVGLAIVGVIVGLCCLAVGAAGFWFLSRQPIAPGMFTGSSPQTGTMPARVAPTLVQSVAPIQKASPAAPAQPASLPLLPQDANALLIAARTQVANLTGTRFTFDRTDGTTTSKGSGWLQMPDRAIYISSEGSERVIVRNQMWSRPNSTAAWSSEIYMGPLNNPITWLQILQCVTSPRVMPASTASGETLSTLSFILASNAATCASAGSVQALSGEGTVALRSQNDGITRLYYNLTYTGQQLRGGVNAPFQIAVEFSDWNSGNLPAIEAPR